MGKERSMIRDKQSREHIIDLTGPNGNAYYLIALASRTAKEINVDGDAIIQDMTSGDYENLIQVFDREFGHYFILER
jgi:hypothetical protein